MTTAERIEIMGASERARALRMTRERIGWTQQDAAARFGVNRRTIARWETPDGRSFVPDEVLLTVLETLDGMTAQAADMFREGVPAVVALPLPPDFSEWCKANGYDQGDVWAGREYREAFAALRIHADYVESRGGSVRWV